MDADQLIGAIVVTLICVVIALGLWYLGLRRNSLLPKQLSAIVVVGLVIFWVVQLVPSLSAPPDYRSTAVGPTRREASASAGVAVPVTDSSVPHELRLTARIRGGDPPQQPVHLKFAVRSPKGDTLAEGQGDPAPAKPTWVWYGHLFPARYTPMKWEPLRGQFQPREEGEHTLIIEMPQPISSVDVVVHEIRD